MRGRLSDEQGFTLIELLVVILIIGILAAIALPVFLGQRAKSQDAEAKSNVRNAFSHVELCFNERQSYAACQTVAALGSQGNTGLRFVPPATAVSALNPGEVVVTQAAPTTVTVVTMSQSGNLFAITRASDGSPERECTQDGTTNGGCLRTTPAIPTGPIASGASTQGW